MTEQQNTEEPLADILERLASSQKACFDAGQHIAAMDIQAARASLASFLSAPAASTGGEPVAWQYRTGWEGSDAWADWAPSGKEQYDRIVRTGKIGSYPAEARELYAALPAAKAAGDGCGDPSCKDPNCQYGKESEEDAYERGFKAGYEVALASPDVRAATIEIERLREDLESALAQVTIAKRSNGFQLLDRAATIEECAKVCESGEWTRYVTNHSPTKSCAIAIRALSQAPATDWPAAPGGSIE